MTKPVFFCVSVLGTVSSQAFTHKAPYGPRTVLLQNLHLTSGGCTTDYILIDSIQTKLQAQSILQHP